MTHAARKYFLAKDLLDELQTERNEQGTGTHLRVQELLRHLPDDISDENLLLALAPILAKSPREQALVYEKFKICQRRADEIFGERPDPTPAPPDPIDQKIRRSKIGFWLATAALLGLLGWLAWLFFRPSEVPFLQKDFAVTAGRATQICPKGIPELDSFGKKILKVSIESSLRGYYNFTRNKADWRGIATRRDLSLPIPDSSLARISIQNDTCLTYAAKDSVQGMDSLVLRVDFSNSKKCDLRLRIFVAPEVKIDTSKILPDLPFFEKRKIPHDHRQAFLDLKIKQPDAFEKGIFENWWWLRWLIFALSSAILYFLWQWWEFRRRKIIADTDRFNQPPYIWNIEIDGVEEGIVAGEDYQNALQIMRRRAATDSLRLDLPRTIRATAESGGQPTFFFRPLTQPVDYLFLLDRQTEHNHRSQLFDALFRTFRAQELHIERFFYDSDLRVCFNEAYPDGLALDDIAQRFGQARLIVVGTGLQLIHPFDGHLERWAEPLFKNWKERALLTPRPAADWSRNERRLAQIFTLLPATLQSLGFWVDELQHGDDARFERWRERVADAPAAIVQPDDEMPLPMLLLQFPREIVRWVAACAIFPGLHWDLTLWLGKRLTVDGGRSTAGKPSTVDRPPSAVNLENLLKIFRIRWFVEGKIPDTARVALLDWLEKEDPALVPQLRADLATLLEKNPPPENSSAWIDHRLAIVLNRWLGETDKNRKTALEKELSELLPRTEADFTVLKYLDEKPSPLHFEVPRRLRKFVYRGGIPALGFSGGVWSGPAAGLVWLAMAAALFLWKPAAPDDGCRGERVEYIFENQRLDLCLDSPLDSLLWLERLALDTLGARDFEDLDSIENQIKQLLQLPEHFSFVDSEDRPLSWLLLKEGIPDTCNHFFENLSAALQAVGADFANQNQKDSACLFFEKAIGWGAFGWDFSKEKNWCADIKTSETDPPHTYPCRQIINVAQGIGFRKRPLTQPEYDQVLANPRGRLNAQTLISTLPNRSQVELIDSTALAWQVRFRGKIGWIAKFYLDKPTLAPCGTTTTPPPGGGGAAIPVPEMIKIKGGTFTMGCTDEQGSDCSYSEKPAHPVTLSDFEMAKTEVTVAQYMAFVNETKSHYPEWLEAGSDYNINTGSNDVYKKLGAALQEPNHPIVGVSWNDAVAYCQWLSKKTGKKWRLPTEAEWEFAARGGNIPKKTKYAGSNDLGEVGWFSQNSGSKTHPVAQKTANELGLFDMSGNVWEWCADRSGDYKASEKPVLNPTGVESGDYRVYRGGSWLYSAQDCRVSYRIHNSPARRYYGLGFRPVRQ